MKTFFE